MSAMCAAKGCHFMPSRGSLFCYLHPTPIQRKRVVSAEFDDGADWPWPVDSPKPPATPKLVVKWDKVRGAFVATHPNTNVKGISLDSPGAAVRNWQYWWSIPY